VAESVKAFADAFNELRTAITGLQQDELQGDSSLLSIERSLFSIINTPATGLPSGLSYLTEIGVSFQKDGTMIVEDSRLDSALANNFNAVSEVFATSGQGYANRLDTLVDTWLQVDGLLDIRTNSLDDRKRSLEDDELRLEYRLTQIEERFRSQFTMLDTLLGNLQGTSDYLAQQLDNLPGFTEQ
jgi:flagellar hook-associated protein 2